MIRGSYPTYKSELRRTFINYALTPVVVISMLAFGILFYLVSTRLEAQGIQINNKVAEAFQQRVSSFTEQSELYGKSADIIRAIEEPKHRLAVYESIYGFVNAQELGCNFYVFNSRGEMVLSNTTKPPEYITDHKFIWGLFRQMNDDPEQTVVMINRSYSSLNRYGILTIGRAVVNETGVRGYIVFDLLERDLYNLADEDPGYDTVIADRYYNVVITTSNRFTDEFVKLRQVLRGTGSHVVLEDRNFSVKRREVLDGRFLIYTFAPLSFYESGLTIGVLFLTLMFVTTCLIMYFWAIRLADRKTAELEKIVQALNNVESGDMDTPLELTASQEFRIIAASFNSMISEMKALIAKNKEEVQRSMTAEMKLLESQFNPHFLFNTLEVIRCMVKLDPSGANRMILALSSLLRYSIQNTVRDVLLKEDINYINNYLEILKYRFGEKLDYHVDADPEALECVVPKLMVQPLIENAVKHGYGGESPLAIGIRARISEGVLVLRIADNGIGIANDQMTRLSDALAAHDNDQDSIGLFNIHRRIRLQYGEAFGLKLLKNEAPGTVVEIRLPAVRRNDDDQSADR